MGRAGQGDRWRGAARPSLPHPTCPNTTPLACEGVGLQEVCVAQRGVAALLVDRRHVEERVTGRLQVGRGERRAPVQQVRWTACQGSQFVKTNGRACPTAGRSAAGRRGLRTCVAAAQPSHSSLSSLGCASGGPPGDCRIVAISPARRVPAQAATGEWVGLHSARGHAAPAAAVHAFRSRAQPHAI